MTQGTPTNGVNPLVPAVFDLDAELAKRTLDPIPLKLGGKTYHIRQDLTGPEIEQYFKLSRESKDVEALSMLIAKPSPKTAAVTLNKALEALPQKHMVLAVRKIMETAGLVTTAGEVGEFTAS